MTNMPITDKRVAAVPIIMVAVLVIFYVAFQNIYIECRFQPYSKFFECKPVEVALVFPKSSEESKDGKLFIQGKEVESRTLFAERYSGRQVWVFITFVSIIAGIGVLIIASFLIYKSSGFLRETPFIRTIVLIGLSILLGCVLWSWPFYMTKLLGILEHTISMGQGGAKAVVEVMKFAIAFTFVATFALIFATCAILLPRKQVTPIANNDPEDITIRSASELHSRLKPISGQMTDLHTMLYAGTILLVVGVLRLSAVYRWSLAFTSLDEAQAKVVERFISSLVADVGGFFTLILAVVYIPAAYIIHRRAQLLVEESALPLNEQEEILKDRGFTFSFKGALPSSFLILSPTLAGPIGDLFRAWPT